MLLCNGSPGHLRGNLTEAQGNSIKKNLILFGLLYYLHLKMVRRALILFKHFKISQCIVLQGWLIRFITGYYGLSRNISPVTSEE